MDRLYMGSAPSEKAARGADRACVANMDAQIIESESTISSLKEKRKSAQGRLDAYTYPVLTLPNEITSEIIVHFLPIYPKCPSPIGLLSPYLLCQICGKWRDIVFATPALWRAISLPLRNSERLTQALHLLEASSKHSGSCLLSIELTSDSVEGSELAQFGQTIAEHCARLEHLALNIFQPLDALPTDDLLLPYIRTLKLGSGYVGLTTATATFLAAPLLQKVSIHMY
ncbi:hypothetical protein DFH06DRAFT_92831 [Mycena polygramma]|nr:hypothetical protein DFH06DRAFT_92831 [Mycena polygramma]